MKWVDLNNKNTDELKELLIEKRSELFTLRFQAKSNQLKQVSKLNDVKKTITKLKIMLEQREQEKQK